MKKRQPLDVTDVHVTSNDRVDAFTQYPLLDGAKRYTVEVTEFVCPLSTQTALPNKTFFEDDAGNVLQSFFEIRRKRLTENLPANVIGIPYGNDGSSMSTLVTDPVDIFGTKDYLYIFRKSEQYVCSTIGELVFDLQRFFDEFRNVYAKKAADSELIGDDHGGGPDVAIAVNNRFVNVIITPNGTLQLAFSPLFTKHFFLIVTSYGQKILGLPGILAYDQNAEVVITGLEALTNLQIPGLLLEGETDQTVLETALYSLTRYFDHRVRIEIETQIGVPATVVWSSTNIQQLNHVIATFPLNHQITTTIETDNAGVVKDTVKLQETLLNGDVIFRKAEDKITERYLINNSQFFHNIRLELFAVRRKWNGERFLVKRDTMVFNPGEHWTAKLRFRSIN